MREACWRSELSELHMSEIRMTSHDACTLCVDTTSIAPITNIDQEMPRHVTHRHAALSRPDT